MLVDKTLNGEYRRARLLTRNSPMQRPDRLEESPEVVMSASVVGICILAAGVILVVGCTLGGAH